MTWSTRELANLAGTTLNSVRYYHRQGLLDEPARAPNGYKQYGAEHLVRLLQIRRLRDLGVPVAAIRRTEGGVGASAEVLRALDAELRETVERARSARIEIAALLEHGSVATLPPGFADVAERLSPADRAMVLLYAQLYVPEAMEDVRRSVEGDMDAATLAFESLPEDADETVRERLVEELSVTIEQVQRSYPWMTDPRHRLRRSPVVTAETMAETMRSLYNEAQLDVLVRAAARAQARIGADGA